MRKTVEQQPKKRPSAKYNAAYYRIVGDLNRWRQALAQEEEEEQRLLETSLLLGSFLHIQQRVASIYAIHQKWAASGGPLSTPQEQPQPRADNNNWVLSQLEAATWEQLRHVQQMRCEDWACLQRSCFKELLELLELRSRCHQLQEGISVLRSNTQAQAQHSNRQPTQQEQLDNNSSTSTAPPLWDVTNSTILSCWQLIFLGMLHQDGHGPLCAAASTQGPGVQDCKAPQSHWVTAAQRVGFTTQQKAHFHFALQLFAAQARTIAQRVSTLLQEASNDTLALAVRILSSEQQQQQQQQQLPSTDDGSDGTTPSHADCPAAGARAAAAAKAGAAAGAGAAAAAAGMVPCSKGYADHGSLLELSNASTDSTNTCMPAAVCAAAEAALAPAAAAAAAAPSHLATAGAGGSAGAGQASEGAGAAGSQQQGRQAGVTGSAWLAQELQRQLSIYNRNVLHLNFFLASTCTLEQMHVLTVASYPFWPHLPAIAEAAVQLPDTDTQADASLDEGARGRIDAHMESRRNVMIQEAVAWRTPCL